MSEHTTTPCDSGQRGGHEVEHQRQDENTSVNMLESMARMMAHCRCAPHLMANEAESTTDCLSSKAAAAPTPETRE